MTKDDLVLMGCDLDDVQDWFDYRKKKRKPEPSARAIRRMQTEAEKAGMTLPQAVRECADREWIGFRAEYVQNQQQQQMRAQKATVAEALRDINNTDW